MKLWISGEVDSSVAEQFRFARNNVEESINRLLLHSDYGNGLENWDIIIVISKNPGKEEFKFFKKRKETDIRIQLNYQIFSLASSSGQQKLLVETLIKSLQEITEKYEIDNFDCTSLITKLTILMEDAI